MIETIKTTLIAVWTAWLGFIGALGTQTTNEPSLIPTPATEAIIEEYQAQPEQELIGLPMPTETPTITLTLTLTESLKKYNISPTISQVISDYFDGKGRKMNYNEARQWLGAYNQAKTELKKNELFTITQKESLLTQMNEIIKQGATIKK